VSGRGNDAPLARLLAIAVILVAKKDSGRLLVRFGIVVAPLFVFPMRPHAGRLIEAART